MVKEEIWTLAVKLSLFHFSFLSVPKADQVTSPNYLPLEGVMKRQSQDGTVCEGTSV